MKRFRWGAQGEPDTCRRDPSSHNSFERATWRAGLAGRGTPKADSGWFEEGRSPELGLAHGRSR